jgi:23S rRNA (adenine-N6)-dimethyltransferase
VRSRRDRRRRLYGQNFLASRDVAAQLVRDADVRPDDFVVEVGAGSGVLTAELTRRAGYVQAIELDPVWAGRLRERFARHPRGEIVEGDALRLPIPTQPFRVVANLPFGATTAFLRRFLDDPRTPLQRLDVLVQWEVARKRAGPPRTAISASWDPWWQFRLGRRVPRHAFRPQPAVDAGVLVVTRQAEPLLRPEAHAAFAGFVRGLFDGTLAPDLDGQRWAAMFEAYKGTPIPGQ